MPNGTFERTEGKIVAVARNDEICLRFLCKFQEHIVVFVSNEVYACAWVKFVCLCVNVCEQAFCFGKKIRSSGKFWSGQNFVVFGHGFFRYAHGNFIIYEQFVHDSV